MTLSEVLDFNREDSCRMAGLDHDFSNAVRGKFYNPDGEFNLPIYLEPKIAEFVQKRSRKKKVDRNLIVNHLFRKDMEIIEL